MRPRRSVNSCGFVTAVHLAMGPRMEVQRRQRFPKRDLQSAMNFLSFAHAFECAVRAQLRIIAATFASGGGACVLHGHREDSVRSVRRFQPVRKGMRGPGSRGTHAILPETDQSIQMTEQCCCLGLDRGRAQHLATLWNNQKACQVTASTPLEKEAGSALL